MAVEWRKPTVEEAQLFAVGLEQGIAGEIVLGGIDPDLQVEVLPELARRWAQDAKVRAARFDFREWLKKSTEERAQTALTRTRNGMAAHLMTVNWSEVKDSAQLKALKFVEVLEKFVAGTSGQSDPMALFFERFQKDVAAKAKHPERVQ